VTFTVPTFLRFANDRLSLRPRFCTLPLGSVDKNSRNILSVHLNDTCTLVTKLGSPKGDISSEISSYTFHCTLSLARNEVASNSNMIYTFEKIVE
jgi:hypothetical protein